MFQNNLRVAFRNFLKQKAYNILNTIGLAIGTNSKSGEIVTLRITSTF